MLVSTLIYALLLALAAHLTLRLLLRSPSLRTRLFLFFARRASLMDRLTEEIGRFADSSEVQDKMSTLFQNHLKNTFAEIKAKVPFAASFLSSDFVRKIELEAEEAILAVMPDISCSIKGEMQKQFNEQAVERIVSSKGKFCSEKELWQITLAAFTAGLILALAAEAIKAVII
ncbi:hypothetical protein [Estrella lausannensis]|uniref:Putative membrane protein n=1 Tax=Estrella lausannensis TaxID=483423 RepID=A0A0H5DNP1_9BACT|nr:hypothetical protein [Estrella lausannensis]CRX37882.1 putative membrane protein [Estrella lausannensis]